MPLHLVQSINLVYLTFVRTNERKTNEVFYSAVGGKGPPFYPKPVSNYWLYVCKGFIPCGLQLFSALLKDLLSLETRSCISSELHRLKMPWIYSLGHKTYQVSNISDYHIVQCSIRNSPRHPFLLGVPSLSVWIRSLSIRFQCIYRSRMSRW